MWARNTGSQDGNRAPSMAGIGRHSGCRSQPTHESTCSVTKACVGSGRVLAGAGVVVERVACRLVVRVLFSCKGMTRLCLVSSSDELSQDASAAFQSQHHHQQSSSAGAIHVARCCSLISSTMPAGRRSGPVLARSWRSERTHSMQATCLLSVVATHQLHTQTRPRMQDHES